MTRDERNNWIANIENTASFIETEIGAETVDFVLGKYGAKSVEQISSSDLPDVFNELYAIEADLRSDCPEKQFQKPLSKTGVANTQKKYRREIGKRQFLLPRQIERWIRIRVLIRGMKILMGIQQDIQTAL